MKLIVGLGNPGKKYETTRHNVGTQVVERFAESYSVSMAREKFSSFVGEGTIEGERVLLVLPQTFMNRSGLAVVEAIRFYKIEPAEMIVIHDDIDLEVGRMKLDFDSGAAGHRGVLSIMDEIGAKDFFRLRLGIGRPSLKEEVEGYVLSPFRPEEMEAVEVMKKEGMRQIQEWICSYRSGH